MSPRALQWFAQDRVEWKGAGKIWLTLGAVAWLFGVAIWMLTSRAKDRFNVDA